MIFMMSIWPNDSFLCLLIVRDGLCWALFIFSVRSCTFLCVPVYLLCTIIGLCQALFINCVLYCAFSMASDRTFLEICQSCALSMPQIGLCWTFACPVSMLCPNSCVFIRSLFYPRINLSQKLAIAMNQHFDDLLFIL